MLCHFTYEGLLATFPFLKHTEERPLLVIQQEHHKSWPSMPRSPQPEQHSSPKAPPSNSKRCLPLTAWPLGVHLSEERLQSLWFHSSNTWNFLAFDFIFLTDSSNHSVRLYHEHLHPAQGCRLRAEDTNIRTHQIQPGRLRKQCRKQAHSFCYYALQKVDHTSPVLCP